MAMTKAQLNKSIRQEALRAQLANQKHIEHVVENLNEMRKLDGTQDTDKFNLDKLKIINEQKMKLINKYLPDLSNVAISQEVEHTVSKPIPITVVDAS